MADDAQCNSSVHDGPVCAHCLRTPEASDEKMKRCGQCKQTTYCSVECQKGHWPYHKTMCKQNKDTVDCLKETHGDGFVKSWTKWVTKESIRGLSVLVVALMADRTHTHVLSVMTEHHADSKPKFKVVSWEVLSLEELRRMNPHMHQVIINSQQQGDEQLRKDLSRGVATAFVLIICSDVDDTGRVVPLALEHLNPLPMTPEQIATAMNAGIFNRLPGV